MNYNVLFKYFNEEFNTKNDFNNILNELLIAFNKGSICIDISDDELKVLNKYDVLGLNKPLVIANNKLYFQKYYLMEQNILNKVNELIKLNKFRIITGGPGTGKTTSVSKEVANLLKENINYDIALAAPTGKASARMVDAINTTLRNSSYSVEAMLKDDLNKELIIDKISKLKSSTIHNLIGARPMYTDYKYSNKYINKDIIVIDEASMIDIELMDKLLNAINKDEITKLYLVGDQDQLTSVDVGSVFKDLCDLIDDSTVKTVLTKNYRASEALNVLKLVDDIKNENINSLTKFSYGSEVIFGFDFNKIIENKFIKDMVQSYYNAKNINDALNLTNKVMILTAYLNGLFGSKYLNDTILSKNPNLKYIPYIVLKSDPARNIYNGDIGILNKADNKVYFSLDKVVDKIYLSNIEVAFAITIHKSQGSEYDDVLLILKDDEIESDFITKELIYTGVSRAKKRLNVLTGKKTFLQGIKKSINRASGISKVRD